MENLKLIVLMNNQILITRIEESPSELGEPDCKLINPNDLPDFDLLTGRIK